MDENCLVQNLYFITLFRSQPFCSLKPELLQRQTIQPVSRLPKCTKFLNLVFETGCGGRSLNASAFPDPKLFAYLQSELF